MSTNSQKNTVVKIHAAAASIALLLIITFFSSSIISEISGDAQTITMIKNAIFYGIWVLIPVMMITGATGANLAGNAKKGLIGKKMKRMPLIAMNGLLILVPAAIYLRSLALAGEFNSTFYVIQGAELIAGGVNIVLMSMNFRDGIKVSKAKRKNNLRHE